MKRLLTSIVILISASWGVVAKSCPFCPAAGQTLSAEMDLMDAVVIAELIEPPVKADNDTKEVPKGKFKVVQVVKGQSLIKPNHAIETIYLGDAKQGLFLMMGVEPNNLMWSTPMKLTDRGCNYISQLPALPKEGSKRLEFFQEYLEDPEKILAIDAFDEFAKAPYKAVQDLKKNMHHEKLVAWIRNPEITHIRRRLYLTMLGVCGGPQDVVMLEEFMKSNDPKAKAGLDALIACYLSLTGADGMSFVEELYLKNAKAANQDTQAALIAIRFHGNDTNVIPKPRLITGMRYVLDRPEVADLVIADLAQWQDWEVMDKLVQLFKTNGDKETWLRVPVINYLRACPKPQAKKYLEELARIDPAAVNRASNFSPPSPSNVTEIQIERAD
jgi:hypothetical protein